MRKRICPKCGSKSVAFIQYGLPLFSEELQGKLESKEVVLGGCIVTGDDPQFRCNSCGADFGRETSRASRAPRMPR